jgi:hypothetical protein
VSRRVAILISAILLLGMAIPAVAKDEIRIVSVSPATTKPLGDPSDGDFSWGFIRGACRALATRYR